VGVIDWSIEEQSIDPMELNTRSGSHAGSSCPVRSRD
jgi:hypothetical protein